ncbi:RNA polymerase sigma factor [Pontiella agarivorans]|uniref:RNA polymerase sigma factor n=1 Tax=Pontiella agarivorans TaxID=3038953 RepID=A0ABU5MY51_9BACT|nr:sigma-70 family RNA polymerase sigma factor [Pontiella agarivorans]MDZ8119119.1 sigma-70 family RNA polymerase sigma factor [Pontiella agarivorans]
MEDAELIVRSQNDDLDAFSELVIRYQSNVRACLSVRLSSAHEADDLAQDAFIIAFRKLDQFNPEKPFGPWIRTIALNLLKNYFRKHRAHPVGGAVELEELINLQVKHQCSAKTESEMMTALKRCMTKLDGPMAGLLQLRYYEGLSIKEITETMNVRHSTMTMRLHRLRDQLRRCIEQKSEGVS